MNDVLKIAPRALPELSEKPGDPDAPDVLTGKQEAFARAFVETGGALMRSYRSAYNINPARPAGSVYVDASRTLSVPKVARRVRELRDAASQDTIIRANDLLRDWVDIASADPNELVRVERRVCRYCTGVDFGYHWIDANEWAVAVATAMDSAAKTNAAAVIPSDAGGFGFNPTKPPRPECPRCFGEGTVHTILADTATLSPKAAKLYAGATENQFGVITIKMHDQQKARESIARMLGAFKDQPGAARDPVPPAPPGGGPVSPDEAAKAYLRFVSS